MHNKVGQLLIAHPNLPEQSPFYKTIVYIFSDNSEGTQGMIVNKPTKYPVNEFMQAHGFAMPTTKERMRFGGPVNTKTVFMLHTNDWDSAGSIDAGKGLSLSYDGYLIEKLSMGTQPGLWRMAVGICAWQPGQLDMELQGRPPYRPENSWLTAEADDSILFEHDGVKQWQKAVELSSRQMINCYI